MTNRILGSFVSAIAFALIAAAGTSDFSVKIPKALVVNGTALAPGTYGVQFDASNATFWKGGKQAATSPVQVVHKFQKYESSELVVEGSAIKEIHFGGKIVKLILAPSGNQGVAKAGE